MSTNKSFAIYQKVRLGVSGTEPGRLFNSTDTYQDLTGELGMTCSGVVNQGTLSAIQPIAPSLPACTMIQLDLKLLHSMENLEEPQEC